VCLSGREGGREGGREATDRPTSWSCGPCALQSAEASSRQKTDVISGLEDKINQMAGTVKQLESR